MLTGYTDRQEIMIVWGNEAGNGKSLLWGEIMPSLVSAALGKTKYYARITSDAFADTGNPNNDQLYYLNGKRYAFMSEPRRGMKSAFDNELLKTITGDKDFTAQAKYKNKLTFRLLVKIVCACNDLPDFNFDDKGTYRRIVILEQNIPCLEESDYYAVAQEVRDKGLVVKKDKDFVNALLADREGTLKWVMEGAMRYMANPLQPVPEVMKASKAKAKETVDVISQWLRGNLEAGQRTLTFRDIKDEWRRAGLDFGQNKKGFSAKLAAKIRLLGYTVDEGRPGKSEEKVMKCGLVPDKFDGQID
jgi:phage/plasmid-associated DNA primase